MRSHYRFSILDLMMLMVCTVSLIIMISSLIARRPWQMHGDIYCAAYSTVDGKLYLGCEDGAIRRWDTKTGRVVKFGAHTNLVASVDVSPNGEQLVSASRDGTVGLWDLQTGAKSKLNLGFAAYSSVAFSPDGITIAAAENGIGSVALIDVASVDSSSHLPRISIPANVSDVKFISDGLIVTETDNSTISAWDARTGRLVWQLGKPNSFPTCLAVSCDGTQVAVGWNSIGVTIHDSLTGSEASHLQSVDERVSSVAFSPNGKSLVTGSAADNVDMIYGDGIRFSRPENKRSFVGVRIWDLENNALVASVPSGTTSWTTAFSPDGKSIAIGTENWIVQVRDAVTLELLSKRIVIRETFFGSWILLPGTIVVWILLRRWTIARTSGGNCLNTTDENCNTVSVGSSSPRAKGCRSSKPV